MFFSQSGGLTASLPHPAIPYSNDSPIYGSFGDFSYTDSSSDISPSIAHCWSIDDDTYGVGEKNFIALDPGRDNIHNRHRIEHNRQNYERTLNMDDNNENSDDAKDRANCNLTTINEESANVVESPQK